MPMQAGCVPRRTGPWCLVPVGPGLRADPGAGVEAVIGFVQILYKLPFRVVTPAAILEYHDIAVTNIVPGHFGARAWRRIGSSDVAEIGYIATVGSALQDD